MYLSPVVSEPRIPSINAIILNSREISASFFRNEPIRKRPPLNDNVYNNILLCRYTTHIRIKTVIRL